MENVGFAALQIIPSMKGFESKLASDTTGPFQSVGSRGGKLFGDSAGKSLVSGFKAHAKTAALAGAAAFTAVGVGAFKLAKDSISAASDLSESQNKVQQVFGKSADSIFKFTSHTADSFGQTNQQARDAVATFGIFGHVADLSEKKTAKFAIRMDKLASDLASFHNTSPEQAIEAIGAALRGESEPIRAYGVLLDEASLKAEALRLGLIKPVKDKAKIQSYQVAITDGQNKYNEAVKKYGTDSLEALKAEASLGTARDRLKKATEGTIPPLTQQQKVIAAQKLILEQTTVAHGDFARTSDGLANSQRRLSARWEDAKAKLGEGLLPIVQDFVGFLLDKGIPKVDEWVGVFEKKGVPALKHFYEKAKPVAKDVLPAMVDAFDRLKPILKKSAEFAGDMAEQFTKMPKWAQTAIVGGLLAGKAGGFKLAVGLGKNLLGGKGGLLGGVSKAAPLPVLVVNEGFGGVGGKGGPAGVVAGGGKVATLAKATLLVGSVYLAGKAFKDSGIPQKISQKVFGTDEDTIGKVLDGDQKAIDNLKAKMKSASELNITAPFDAVNKAIDDSIPLMWRYRHILEGTPRDIRTQVGLSGYEKAIGQINTLQAGIDALAGRGTDNGLPYLHGGTRSSGVNVNIGTVHVKDGRDLLNKSQQAALGGRRTY